MLISSSIFSVGYLNVGEQNQQPLSNFEFVV